MVGSHPVPSVVWADAVLNATVASLLILLCVRRSKDARGVGGLGAEGSNSDSNRSSNRHRDSSKRRHCRNTQTRGNRKQDS